MTTEAELRCVIADLQRECAESRARIASLEASLKAREIALASREKAIKVAFDAIKDYSVATNACVVRKARGDVHPMWKEIGTDVGKLKDVAARYGVSPSSVHKYRNKVQEERVKLLIESRSTQQKERRNV